MKKIFRRSMKLFVLAGVFTVLSANAQDDSPAMAKFKQDMKAAVLNGSITVGQVKQLQTDAETLKAAKAEQVLGAPIDLLTPYRAVANMKATMAGVAPKDREILHQDLQAVLATKTHPDAAADPSPGKKLGRDIFKAIMFGAPTEAQVTQLQSSLNDLQGIKGEQGHPLQQLRALSTSKSQIEEVMNTDSFRPEERQAVLDDLNSLGGGGRK
ncbi:MAG TPA: hypothetical protein VK638_02740 [Edaphobacter sp.]|nr:hypothetical protein [Edaphobacter sp.]